MSTLLIVFFVIFYHSSLFGQTIIIDPQYGGKEYGGCTSNEMVCAKDLSLQIARKLGEKLRNNFKVIYTRETDLYLTTDERIDFANNNNGDFFLRIGIAESANDHERGIEVHSIMRRNFKIDDIDGGIGKSPQENELIHKHFNALKTKYETGYKMAQIFYAELAKSFEMKTDKVKPDISAILDNVEMPAITVTIGYLTNIKDVAMMNSKSFQEKITQALYRATNKTLEHSGLP